MEWKVLSRTGSDTGRVVTLPDHVFGIEPNDHVIYLDVKQHLANRRQGTHKTLERSELKGSTRKLYRQKGTGSARKGDINSPLLRGGARVFGPQPRSYRGKINKQVKDLARRSALTYKARSQNLIVVEDFDFETPRTKAMLEICSQIQVNDRKALVILPEDNANVYLSARNVRKLNVLPARQVNTYSIVNAQVLVLMESSIQALGREFDDR